MIYLDLFAEEYDKQLVFCIKLLKCYMLMDPSGK